MTTIYKNEKLQILFRDNKGINDTQAITVRVLAENPVDKKSYEDYAGWLSHSLALHGGKNTPRYIYLEACQLIEKYQDEIINSLKLAGRFFDKKITGGKGVTYKVAHPAINYRQP